MKEPIIKLKTIVMGGVIAAAYVALTLLSSFLGISSGFIQLRLSEALCILPIFTPAAVPGLFVGCIIGNLITGSMITDIICGSLATLLGALGTYFLRKNRYLAVIPPILVNAIILPFIFIFVYGSSKSYFYFLASIFISEFIMVALLGSILYSALEKYPTIFEDEDDGLIEGPTEKEELEKT